MMEFLKGKVMPVDLVVSGAIVLLAVALCGAFVFLVILPEKTSLAETQQEIAKSKEDLKQAQKLTAGLEDFREKSDRERELVEKFEERLPPEEEIPALLRTFEGFGARIGMRVNLASLPRKKDPRKETIPYKVEALGDFHQIVTFINLLERYQRYFKISDLEIDEEKDGVAEAQFVLSTYRFVESAEEEKVEKEKK